MVTSACKMNLLHHISKKLKRSKTLSHFSYPNHLHSSKIQKIKRGKITIECRKWDSRGRHLNQKMQSADHQKGKPKFFWWYVKNSWKNLAPPPHKDIFLGGGERSLTFSQVLSWAGIFMCSFANIHNDSYKMVKFKMSSVLYFLNFASFDIFANILVNIKGTSFHLVDDSIEQKKKCFWKTKKKQSFLSNAHFVYFGNFLSTLWCITMAMGFLCLNDTAV